MEFNAAVYSLGGGTIPDNQFFPSEENQEAFCPSNVESRSGAIYYDAKTGVVLDMPPLEAGKLLCSLPASKKVSRFGRPLKLALCDISRVHFYARAQRTVCATLPEGDKEEGMCALLMKTMYSAMDYTDHLQTRGYTSGRAWTSLFRNDETACQMLVHLDDLSLAILKCNRASRRRWASDANLDVTASLDLVREADSPS